MKVAVIGASGRGGSRIVAELAQRGHQVTAIARNTDKLPSGPNITAMRGDLSEIRFPGVLAGHDAVVSAVRFATNDAKTLLNAVKTSGVDRFIVMGGAGSLFVAPGKKLIDTPQFPEASKPEATKASAFLDVLRNEQGLEWTFMSPSALIQIGERTGKFRLGDDDLLVGADGRSTISFEDFAVAVVDELENPKHIRKRFTVGY